MRILIVAMVNSIHTARWVAQFDGDTDKEIFLLPSALGGARDELKNWPRLLSGFLKYKNPARGLVMHLPWRKLNGALHLALEKIYPAWRLRWLLRTIKILKPDIIHTLEFQSAGYLALQAKQKMGKDFPVWIATNWGSDIYLFSRQEEHLPRIEGILKEADFYSAECQRDYRLADDLGMTAKPLPVIPNAGGMDLATMEAMRSRAPTSQRKMLLIKGYQTMFGRALTVLQAVETVAADLRGMKICIFLATPDVAEEAALLAARTGLAIEVIPQKNTMPHEDILSLHAQARAYVGLSISDGISTSMLEAMALGAFPIQTCTSCANEWIEDGVSGFIAPLDDVKVLGQMIKRAMTEDDLVDHAAAQNLETMRRKADYESVREVARSFYVTAMKEAP